MTMTMLFLIIAAALAVKFAGEVFFQLWLVDHVRRRDHATKARVFSIEPPSFSDDELEEQVIAQERAIEGFERLERRRKEAVERLIKRGAISGPPRSPIVRAVPPVAS